ncbi:hypothetical protein PR048_032989 [Dryococelus australis]|uniref:THAP-type domain-containing protein n=1 Tax=Dryococelus australis TaxID=614101 RepID=A0ABQ9G3S5_9NEOP|nr:hypothetical protein PR048_032989 [Dryococelus australis]
MELKSIGTWKYSDLHTWANGFASITGGTWKVLPSATKKDHLEGGRGAGWKNVFVRNFIAANDIVCKIMVNRASCCVPDCENVAWKCTSPVSFFRFPKDNPRCTAWVQRVDPRLSAKPLPPLHNLRVCAVQFTEDQFMNTHHDRLIHYAVPSLHLPPHFPANIDLNVSSVPNVSVAQENQKTNQDFSNASLVLGTAEETCDVSVISSSNITDSLNVFDASDPVQNCHAKECLYGSIQPQPSSTTESRIIYISSNASVSGNKRQFKRSLLRELELTQDDNTSNKSKMLKLNHKTYESYRHLRNGVKETRGKMKKLVKLASCNDMNFFLQHNPSPAAVALASEDARNRLVKPIHRRSGMHYNESADRVEGFEDFGNLGRTARRANHAMVFMARGHRTKWKQPLAYYLCQSTTPAVILEHIIVEIIRALSSVGIYVKAVVCDQGSTNRLFAPAYCPLQCWVSESSVHISFSCSSAMDVLADSFHEVMPPETKCWVSESSVHLSFSCSSAMDVLADGFHEVMPPETKVTAEFLLFMNKLFECQWLFHICSCSLPSAVLGVRVFGSSQFLMFQCHGCFSRWFSRAIRQHEGDNNNPTAGQFTAAFKTCLLSGLGSSRTSRNCEDDDGRFLSKLGRILTDGTRKTSTNYCMMNSCIPCNKMEEEDDSSLTNGSSDLSFTERAALCNPDTYHTPATRPQHCAAPTSTTLPPPGAALYRHDTYHTPATRPQHCAAPTSITLPHQVQHCIATTPTTLPPPGAVLCSPDTHHTPATRPQHCAAPTSTTLPPPSAALYRHDTYHTPATRPQHCAAPTSTTLPPPGAALYRHDTYHTPATRPQHCAAPTSTTLPPPGAALYRHDTYHTPATRRSTVQPRHPPHSRHQAAALCSPHIYHTPPTRCSTVSPRHLPHSRHQAQYCAAPTPTTLPPPGRSTVTPRQLPHSRHQAAALLSHDTYHTLAAVKITTTSTQQCANQPTVKGPVFPTWV